jgi:hypothetical protein
MNCEYASPREDFWYLMNSTATFNPRNKDRRLHRHSAFFGTMIECLEDCCEVCRARMQLVESLTFSYSIVQILSTK